MEQHRGGEMAKMLDRAQHEFGHHIVARALGFAPGDVSAEISGNAGGTSAMDTSRPLMTVDDIVQFCEDRIKVLYAGVLAETLRADAIDNAAVLKLAHSTGKMDHMMVQQLCNLLRNVRYANDPKPLAERKMQADEARLWNESARLVVLYAPLIQNLAKELHNLRADHGKPAIMTELELNQHPMIVQHFPKLPLLAPSGLHGS